MKVLTIEQNNNQQKALFIRHMADGSESHLDTMYKYLDCRCVDVMEIERNGKTYDMWFDDEYLYSHGNTPSATLFIGDLKPRSFNVICGNVLFAHHDEEGATTGLTEDDYSNLIDFIQNGTDKLLKAAEMGLIHIVRQ